MYALQTILCIVLSSNVTNPSVNETKTYLFNYFEENIGPNGGVYDRDSDKNLISVASTGFAFKVWSIGVAEGRISREKSLSLINQSFDFIIKNNPASNRGLFFHFYNLDGSIPPNIEVSTVDTAIFYLGARQAAWELFDIPLIFKVNYYFYKIDITWLIKDGYISHGFYYSPTKEIIPINYLWDDYSEGIMVYKLFKIPYKPKNIRKDLSLFTYYYPLCFFDDWEIKGYLVDAINWQKQKYGYWSITATDTQNKGYQAFDSNTISPITILTLSYYLGILDETTERYTGLTGAKDILTGWESSDKIGIDFGACYILLSKIKMEK